MLYFHQQNFLHGSSTSSWYSMNIVYLLVYIVFISTISIKGNKTKILKMHEININKRENITHKVEKTCKTNLWSDQMTLPSSDENKYKNKLYIYIWLCGTLNIYRIASFHLYEWSLVSLAVSTYHRKFSTRWFLLSTCLLVFY